MEARIEGAQKYGFTEEIRHLRLAVEIRKKTQEQYEKLSNKIDSFLCFFNQIQRILPEFKVQGEHEEKLRSSIKKLNCSQDDSNTLAKTCQILKEQLKGFKKDFRNSLLIEDFHRLQEYLVDDKKLERYDPREKECSSPKRRRTSTPQENEKEFSARSLSSLKISLSKEMPGCFHRLNIFNNNLYGLLVTKRTQSHDSGSLGDRIKESSIFLADLDKRQAYSLTQFQGRITDFDLNGQYSVFVTGASTVTIYDSELKQLNSLETEGIRDINVIKLANNQIVLGSHDGYVEQLQLNSEGIVTNRKKLNQHTYAIYSIDANSGFAATGSSDKTAKVWSLQCPTNEITFSFGKTVRVVRLLQNYLFSGSQSQKIHVHDLESKSEIYSFIDTNNISALLPVENLTFFYSVDDQSKIKFKDLRQNNDPQEMNLPDKIVGAPVSLIQIDTNCIAAGTDKGDIFFWDYRK